jgi:hypothetical protein
VVGLPVGESDGLGVSLGRSEKLLVRRFGVSGGEARLGLSVELLRGRSLSGIPTVCVAVFDASDGGENLSNIHDALGGVAYHRTGNEIKAGIGEEAGCADRVWCNGLVRWASQELSNLGSCAFAIVTI